MPNIPNVPGVPPLSGYGPGVGALAFADAVLIGSQIATTLHPEWGIFLNGRPVLLPASMLSQAVNSVVGPIAAGLGAVVSAFGGSLGAILPVFASMIEFEYRRDYAVATYPIERGGFQSYDKVQLPFDVRLRLASGGSAVQRQQFLSIVEDMCNSLDLYDVRTPERDYSSLNATHHDFRRTNSNGVSLISVDIYFTQIRITSPSTISPAATPALADQEGTGSVEAAPIEIPGLNADAIK